MSGKSAKKARLSEELRKKAAEEIVLVIQVNVHQNGSVSVQNFPNNEHAAMHLMIKGLEALNQHFTQLAKKNKRVIELDKSIVGADGKRLH